MVILITSLCDELNLFRETNIRFVVFDDSFRAGCLYGEF
jgi:hypothetical protein